MRAILFFLPGIFFFISCTNRQIANPKDYNSYLENTNGINQQIVKADGEISFWEKRLERDGESFVDILKLASNYAKRFKITGDVNDLHIADSFYTRSIQIAGTTDPEIYFSVAQNDITQHRFKEAWNNISIADSIGVNPYVLSLVKFDIAMELGMNRLALNSIEKLADKNGFDYLIRKAKWEDHNGDLGKAIILMEKALKDAEITKKESLILWAKSNLADMYGHAGRVEEAYHKYLEVLQLDSNYYYALKGIAWISFSHDHNTNEAKRIINYVLSQTKMPDLYLMLAEINDWEKNEAGKQHNIKKFISCVQQPFYGNMYNKYLVTIYTDELSNYHKALEIARKEVNNRPTPETFSWLAWTYFKMGENQKAYEIAKTNVIGKDFEPTSQCRMAFILKSIGEKEKADKIFRECLKSSFELGPVTTKQIREII